MAAYELGEERWKGTQGTGVGEWKREE